jgi:hypothetical protein
MPHARARGERRFRRGLMPTDLLEPPERRCRLWADVAVFVLAEFVVRRFWFGATMELERSGRSMVRPDADVGFAGSGRRRWCRRRSSAASYGVIDNRSEILQH